MAGDITLELMRIVNWFGEHQQVKIEVTFLSVSSKAYIAHKSLIASVIDNTLFLNIMFKISYQPDQNHILCKVSLFGENGKKKQLIGEVHVDLDLLSKTSGKVLYLPLANDQTKIIEIRHIDPNENFAYDSQLQHQNNEQNQEAFLKQRYEFLELITKNEIQMKKNFSEKVYNLLKDIKYARASDNMKKQILDKKHVKDLVENENGFETPMRENVDRDQDVKFGQKGNTIDERNAPRNPKQIKNYKLMIDSIHTYGTKDSASNNVRNENKYY